LNEFHLHSRLLEDTIHLDSLLLSRVLLMNDRRYPWLILVPERPNITEIFQLCEREQLQLMQEIACLAQELAHSFQADKMNIATLGNITPQLHCHLIVRYRSDLAWPQPVWSTGRPETYSEQLLQTIIPRLHEICANTKQRLEMQAKSFAINENTRFSSWQS
jgi:diadenosine tetraphosphate (Ap4A) HIT family hydrolase